MKVGKIHTFDLVGVSQPRRGMPIEALLELDRQAKEFKKREEMKKMITVNKFITCRAIQCHWGVEWYDAIKELGFHSIGVELGDKSIFKLYKRCQDISIETPLIIKEGEYLVEDSKDNFSIHPEKDFWTKFKLCR